MTEQYDADELTEGSDVEERLSHDEIRARIVASEKKDVIWSDKNGKHVGRSLGAKLMPPLVSLETIQVDGSVSHHHLPVGSIYTIQAVSAPAKTKP